jgi:hypothetical protein
VACVPDMQTGSLGNRKVASVNRLAEAANSTKSSRSSSPAAAAPEDYNGMKSNFAKDKEYYANSGSGVAISVLASPTNGYGPQGKARDIVETMKQRKGLVAMVLGAVVIFFFFIAPAVFGSGGGDGLKRGAGGASGLSYFPESFRIAIIADLDKRSKSSDGKAWKSIYRTGTLARKGSSYSMAWDEASEVTTGVGLRVLGLH